MPKFWDVGSKFSKTSVKFKIRTFKIGYMQNFVNIRNLILFGPKCPNLDLWTQNFKKQMTNLKAVYSE